MNLKRITFAMLAVLLAVALRAQGTFWDASDAYLGESRPSDTPRLFAPGKLADAGMFVLGRTAFSKDGKEFYYSQNNSWDSGEQARVKMVRYTDGKWGKPVVLNQLFVSPTLSLDNQVLYLRRANNMKNVWECRRTGDGWSAPLPFIDKNIGVYDFMPTLSGRAYVGSDPGPEDVRFGSTYVFSVLTFTNGTFKVQSLGQPLNARGWNGDLFVAPDESYMIVSANETRNFESELHISFRQANSTWTTPVSLGPKINSGLAHRWGQYVTPDGKFLFYCHGTSEKDCAIWWVRFDDLLQKFRPRA